MARKAALNIVISGDQRQFAEAVEKTGGSLDKLGGLMKTGGLAAGAALTVGLVQGMDTEAANDKLAAQLGATGKQSKVFGKIAGDLYANAYGDSLDTVNVALRGVVQNGVAMEDASKRQIESITASVLDLAAAFDQDVGATTRAVGQMIRTGMAKDAGQALDIVTRGFQQGGDKAEDLLDTLNEYGTQFRKLGLDGKEATGLISQGLRAGARDSDIVADAIKEFSIRAVDGSDATAEGFRAIGLNAKDMVARIAEGGPAASKGLDTVLDKLRAVKDPAERSGIAVKLFGTQAEDLGDALYALDPSAAVGALGKVEGAAKRMGATLNDNAKADIESFKRQALVALGEAASEYLIPAIRSAAKWIKSFVAEMRSGEGMGGKFMDVLKGVARTVSDVVTAVARFVEKHPDIGKVAAAVLGVGVALKALKFVSAVTGFTGLIGAARSAMRRVVAIFAAQGAAAGAAGAAGAASGLRSPAAMARYRSAARVAGKAFGVGLAAFALTEIAKTDFGKKVGDLGRKLTNLLPGRDQSRAESDQVQAWFDAPPSKRGPFPMLKKAAGGIVPGHGDGDTVPAMLTPGEFVIRKQVVDRFGPTFFAGLNAQRFAQGGIVGLGKTLQAEGYQVGEHPAFGGVAPVHTKNSYHYRGLALDINGGPGGEPASLDRLAARLRGKAGVAELLWRVKGHYDHLHVAFTGAGNPLDSTGERGSMSTGSGSTKVSELMKRSGPSKSERQKKAGSRLFNRLTKSALKSSRAASSGAAAVGGVIGDADAGFGRSDRFFGQVKGGRPGDFGSEDLETAAGREDRVSELKELRRLKRDQLARMRKRLAFLKKQEAGLIKAIAAVNKALTGKGRARGEKAAKMRDRRKALDSDLIEVRVEIKGLGGEIADVRLDIDEKTGEIADVATPDTPGEAPETPDAPDPGPSAMDKIGTAINSINLQERAGQIDPAEAKRRREEVYRSALTTAAPFGNLTVDETYQIMGDLREAMADVVQAQQDAIAVMRELIASNEALLAFGDRVSAITALQAVRALSDVISGQIAGFGIAGRALTPSGPVARY